MQVLTLFNHKGGVGKTTLTVNLADAFVDLGKTVLLMDTDPQCNLSSFYLPEDQLDGLLEDSEREESEEDEGATGQTLWSAIRPVVRGRGAVKEVDTVELRDRLHLVVGDVFLSEYEEELPSAWTESFARKPRGYDVMCALSAITRVLAQRVGADLVMYDVGPNLGPLNRTVLLDCDAFVTPVHTDLYSLRALTTVGRTVARWVRDWQTVRQLASEREKNRLLRGKPQYLGYVCSAFKVYGGKKAKPHQYWERKLPSRVKLRVVDELEKVDASLTRPAPHKVGDVRHFHSLAPLSQETGVPVGKLFEYASSGQHDQIEETHKQVMSLAKTILARLRGVDHD